MSFKAYDKQPRKRYKLSIGYPNFWYPWGNYKTYQGCLDALKDHNNYFKNNDQAKIRDRSDNSTSFIQI